MLRVPYLSSCSFPVPQLLKSGLVLILVLVVVVLVLVLVLVLFFVVAVLLRSLNKKGYGQQYGHGRFASGSGVTRVWFQSYRE